MAQHYNKKMKTQRARVTSLAAHEADAVATVRRQGFAYCTSSFFSSSGFFSSLPFLSPLAFTFRSARPSWNR